MEQIPPPDTLQELIDRLRKLFKSETLNIEKVKELMSSYRSKRSDWEKYVNFDVNRYTRNLVDEGNGKYNLILLCWSESQGSTIHSHADSHCFMTILDGQLQETLFDWPKGPEANVKMAPVQENVYVVGQTAYINDQLGLHRVENPSKSDKAVSLHLYSPPFDECQCFDQETGQRSKGKVTFWSKFGHLCEPGSVAKEGAENK